MARNRLTDLANIHGSDKGDKHFDRHHYTRIYDPLFEPLTYEPIKFLELGLSHPGNRKEGKHSLPIWEAYFPRAEIVGFDIEEIPGAIQGDASNRDDLAKCGSGFDIVIDDASHASEHQQICLGHFAQHMNPGGLYIIEDLHWQPEWSRGPKTRTVLNCLRAGIGFRSPYVSDAEKAVIESRVESVRFFDSLCPRDRIEHGEALAVIRFR